MPSSTKKTDDIDLELSQIRGQHVPVICRLKRYPKTDKQCSDGLPSIELPPARIANHWHLHPRPKTACHHRHHAAAERVNHRKMKRQRQENGNLQSQRLIPVTFAASHEDAPPDHAEMLTGFGLELSDMGHTLAVRAVPAMLGKADRFAGQSIGRTRPSRQQPKPSKNTKPHPRHHVRHGSVRAGQLTPGK